MGPSGARANQIFSLSQHWYLAGSGSGLQSAEEVGWQVWQGAPGERQYGGDSLFVFSRAHILSFRGWKGSLSQVKHHRASAVMSNASMAGCNRAVADTIAARCASCAQRREDPYDRAQVTFCGR
jgi:hypothetical protein